MPSDRPNLLFLISDQQRADTIEALGNGAIRTPALNRLAAEGTAFTNAYTPAPECVPARCCFTYGQHPAQTACYGNGSYFPDDGRETYMEALARSGYRTHGIGKYHFAFREHERNLAGNGFQARETQEEIVGDPARDDYLRFLHAQGFDHVTDPHGVRGEMYYMPQPAQMPARLHPTQWVGDRAEAFIRAQTGGTEPWHAFVSFIHPHPPFCPPAPWHKLYRDLDVPPPHVPPDSAANWIYLNRFQNRYKRFDQGWDGHRVRMMRAYYYACVSFVDYQVGRILDTLEASGQRENTLVVFTSDHGELLGDFGCVGKRTYHDAASRVPLLLRWPGHVPAGKTCATPTSLLDVTQTLLDAAGTSFETHACEGENLAETASRPDAARTVFTQMYSRESAVYMAVNRRGKYVYSAPDDRELFFDRRRDPGETTDLAGRATGTPRPDAAACAAMKSALHQHLARVGEADSALQNGDWRRYPRRSLPDSPNAEFLYQDHPWAREQQRIPGYSEDAPAV